MKSARIEIILLIVVLFVAVAANEAPLAYDQKSGKGVFWYPPIYPRSLGAYDGWVRETGEFTNVGGTVDTISPVVNIGDDAGRRQYRAFLTFNTASYHIPPTAVIANAVIRMRLQSIVGVNPFPTFDNMIVDMKKPSFGTGPLLSADFQDLPGRSYVAFFVPVGAGWYKAVLNPTGKAYLNKTGTTQFRIYFKLGDDNDSVADYMKFFSGNATLFSVRPKLEIEYYLP